MTKVVALCLAVSVQVSACAAEGFRERCRRYAKEHAALPLRTGMYAEFHSQKLMELLRSADLESVKHCLRSADPKVRTLAAFAVGQGDDPSLLPLLVPLISDRITTFDRTVTANVALFFRDGKMVPSGPPTRTETQDVAKVASRIIGGWTGLGSYATEEGFRAYWEKVKNPEHLASVWFYRLHRAEIWGMDEGRRCFRSRSRAPLKPEEWEANRRRLQKEYEKLKAEKRDKFQQVRRRLADEAPPWLQAVVALSVESWNFEYWTAEERAQVAREHLSREFAFACLRRRPPFDDPSLSPKEMNNWPYKLFCKRLLLAIGWRPEDCGTLLSIEAEELKRENPMAMSEWAVAASGANADEKEARHILKQAIRRLSRRYQQPERWKLANELWDIAGLGEGRYLRGLFYKERESHDNSGGLQEALVKHVSKSEGNGKRFIRELLQDRRSGSISRAVMEAMVRGCNRLAAEEVVREDELRNLHHPLGSYHFSRSLGAGKGKSKYPVETAAVLRTVKDWRKRLTSYAVRHDW